jgi:glutaminase
MNFISPIRLLFKELADSRTPLYSAEENTVIKSVRCTNISNENIRITLEAIALLEHPVQEAFLTFKRLILPNQSVDLLSVICGDSAELVEHRMFDGDNLVCYSDGFSKQFSCVVSGYKENEVVDY